MRSQFWPFSWLGSLADRVRSRARESHGEDGTVSGVLQREGGGRVQIAPFLRYSVRIARGRVPAHQAESALWDRVDRLAAHRTGTPLPPQPPGGSLPRRTR
ncbi:hypothetical protein [Streptomyces sp. NPDC002467]|uniref:hypothetical protein n=1 Tax=Streptomyces sp. NPDC002467 TaxID=3364647 RepID=UPI0036AC20DC